VFLQLRQWYGKLIFDLNGEYFLRGTKTYGLGDIDEKAARENIVVYTDKALPDQYKDSKRFVSGGNMRIHSVSKTEYSHI
jgi:hypothetical protein